MKKIILLILATLTATMNAYAAKPSEHTAAPTIHQFDQIIVDGPVHLILKGINFDKHPSATILSKPNPLLHTTIQHHILFIHAKRSPNLKTLIPITVAVPFVDTLVLKHHASVTGKNVSSSALKLESHTDGRVLLKGQLVVSRIRASDNGLTRISGILPSDIDLRMNDHSVVSLKGRAVELTAKLKGNSKLYANHLNTNQVLIRAEDASFAVVNPHRTLRAFASGHALIYYNYTPTVMTEYSVDHANVLQQEQH